MICRTFSIRPFLIFKVFELLGAFALIDYFFSPMQNKLLILLFLIFIHSVSNAQKWIEMINDPYANFYDVKKEADNFFKTHSTGKGSGFKQYKRWEYEMIRKVDEKGRRINPRTIWNDHLKFQARHRNARISSNNVWTELGPNYAGNQSYDLSPGVGRVTCIAVSATNNNLIFIGSPGGGCWRSKDGGNSWVSLTDNYPVMEVFSLCIDPSNDQIVYMGTNGGGILRTTDGGNSWSVTGNQIPGLANIRRIVVHPNNSAIILAATSSGIYRSSNSGVSWSLSQTGDFNDIKINPSNSSIVYASGNDFFRSNDNGISFTKITNGISTSDRSFIGITKANPNIVYMVQAQGAMFGVLYRSVDAGLSFKTQVKLINNGGAIQNNFFGYSDNADDASGQAWYDMAIAVSPTNPDEVHIGGIKLWNSTDGGLHFTRTPGNIHPDIHSLEFTGNTLFSGNDGGIYKRNSANDNWIDISRGLGIKQFYRLGCSLTNKDIISAGAQDNGTSLLTSAGWKDWLGADGMETFVDPVNSQIVYGTTQNGNLYKTTDGGATNSNINTPGKGNWVTPVIMSPENAASLFIGYDKIYKSINGGSTWNAISPNFDNQNLDVIEVASSDTNTIFASVGPNLYRTHDEGLNWTKVSDVMIGVISDIAIHPDDSYVIAVTTLSGHIYKSENGGDSWTDITGSLPTGAAECAVFQKGSHQGLYVGKAVGVYYIDSHLGDWISFDEGLPNTIPMELEVHELSKKIRVATYGRGIWEAPLRGAECAPSVGVNLSQVDLCEGNNVTLIANGPISSYSWSPKRGILSSTGGAIIVSPGTSIVYTVTGFSSNCDVPGISQIKVLVHPYPHVTSNFSASTCPGYAAQLSAYGATSYTWSPNTGLNTTSGAMVSARPTANTTYQVIGRTEFGCSDTANVKVRVNSSCVKVWTKPPASITGDLKIHYWNVQPPQKGTDWDGYFIYEDPDKPQWYRYTIENATSTSLLFHDGKTYKSPDQNNITGGCYDGALNKWVSCGNPDVPPTLSISPQGGNYLDPFTVTLTATDEKDPNPIIHYTLDGSTPNSASPYFIKQGTIPINKALTLMAYAVDNNVNTSPIQTQKYTFNNVSVWFRKPVNIKSPKIHYWYVQPTQPSSVWDGIYMERDYVKGASWYKYTIKGATKTSLLFHDANGYKTPDMNNITGGCFDGNTGQWIDCNKEFPPVLTIAPKGGNYTGSITITPSVFDEKDDFPLVYYTTDGTTPTTSSNVLYKGGVIYVNKNTTLKAFARNYLGLESPIETQIYTFTPGLTVWFKKPSSIKEPKIHYWYVEPSQPSSVWDGIFMAKDPSKGADWYTYTIKNATKTSLLFHDANGYKTPDMNNITGGCFDGNTGKWVSCSTGAAPFAEPDVVLNEHDLTVREKSESDFFTIYPNPASSTFTVEYTTPTLFPTELKLCDLLGNELLKEIISSSKSEFIKTYSVEHLAPGMYVISINNGEGYSVKKIVLNK